MSNKEKVSYKTPAILDGCKTIEQNLKTIRAVVEAMPDCTIKKSLLTSSEAYEKKINSVVKKEAIQKAMSAIRKNPEKFIASLPDDVKAAFASSDEKIADVIDADAVGANVPKSQKQKGRK
jgi:hypothetical protein